MSADCQHRHYGTWTRERMDAGAAALAALKAAVERRCRCRPGAIWPGCPRHDPEERRTPPAVNGEAVSPEETQ